MSKYMVFVLVHIILFLVKTLSCLWICEAGALSCVVTVCGTLALDMFKRALSGTFKFLKYLKESQTLDSFQHMLLCVFLASGF